jgi:NAD+ diphosphatase
MMKPDRSIALGYALNPLDRMAALRDKPEALQGFEQDERACSFVLAGDVPVLRREGESLDALFSLGEASAMGEVQESVFLGHDGVRPIFAAAFEATLAEELSARDDRLVIDARSIAVQGLLPPEWIGPLAESKSLLYWHARHRFCSVCGHRTMLTSGGWKRGCLSCGAEHFPRTDPVAIMMAVKGDHCVLGRQSRFPPNMYSCLAGFIEPGETIENAVRRELSEEAGLKTGAVRYLASQPWPFPSSLMIGCIAEALDDGLTVDTEELEDARWFSRDEVISMIKGEHPNGLLAPQPIAIAHAIMKAWAMEGEGA